jgi:hypothetical protein
MRTLIRKGKIMAQKITARLSSARPCKFYVWRSRRAAKGNDIAEKKKKSYFYVIACPKCGQDNRTSYGSSATCSRDRTFYFGTKY